MNGIFVVDASVVLTWCFRDEATPLGDYVMAMVQRAQAVAPALLSFEVANSLMTAERRGRITVAEQNLFQEKLRDLSIEIEQRPILWLVQQVLPLARRYAISAYDAAYLDLAIRDGIPLATLDSGLREAALAAGVTLVEAGA